MNKWLIDDLQSHPSVTNCAQLRLIDSKMLLYLSFYIRYLHYVRRCQTPGLSVFYTDNRVL